MQGTLQTLLDRLQGTRDAVQPSLQTFPPLDVQQVAARLDLATRARGNGEHEKPPSDATGPDLAELEIQSEIEQRAGKAGGEYRSNLDLREGRIRRAMNNAELQVEIEAAGQGAVSDLSALAASHLDHLYVAHKEVEGREAEFQDFRRRHGLVRLPNVVTESQRVFRWLVLLIILVLESTINGMFFAEGSQQGLIGGVLQASVLSFMNVGCAVLFAFYGAPLLIHRRLVCKIGGAFALLIYVVLAIALNLLVAHFRDLYIANAGVVSTDELWERVSSTPFNLADVKSWLLFGLGVAFSIISMIDALTLDDVYLGYGAVGRRRQGAIAQYADEKAHCLADLGDRKDEAVAAMTTVIQTLRTDEYDLHLAIEGRGRDYRDFTAHLNHLAVTFERLVRQYREENEKARSTTAPDYFRSVPSRPSFLEAPEPPSGAPTSSDLRAAGIGKMEHYIKAVNEEFTCKAALYESVRQITSAR